MHLFLEQFNKNINATLSDLMTIGSGKRPKSIMKKYSKNFYPVVGASKIVGYTDAYLCNESIMTTGRVGTHGIIQRFRSPVWVSDNSFIIKSDHEDYVYEILKNIVSYSNLNRGSTRPLIAQKDLNSFPVHIPSQKELKLFKEMCTPITSAQFLIEKENVTLKNIRSSILSKSIK